MNFGVAICLLLFVLCLLTTITTMLPFFSTAFFITNKIFNIGQKTLFFCLIVEEVNYLTFQSRTNILSLDSISRAEISGQKRHYWKIKTAHRNLQFSQQKRTIFDQRCQLNTSVSQTSMDC